MVYKIERGAEVDETCSSKTLKFVSVFENPTEDKYLVDVATVWAEASMTELSACMS